jgi:signal transduction histidine kinase
VRRLIGRYQQERQETANVLRYSYERMEAILSSMAEGVLLIDRSGHVVMANRSAAKLLGDTPGSKVEDLLPPTTPTPGQDIRLESLDEHGHQQVLRVNRTPLRPLGWVVTFRDATAEEASQRARSEFVSLASHELRTPITIVSGYVELLLQAEAIGLGHEKQDQILHCIQNQSRRLARIVDDLLKVSRMVAGRMAIRPAAVQLGTVVDEVVGTLALQAEAKGMIIDRDVPAEPLPPVFADADLVVEVLTNLIDNAIKYSPPGTHITVSLATSGRYARLGVTDAGPGIAPAEQSRIFDRFYRVASLETLRERGTGLGLAISRQLTELQGGSLVVCSQSGQGATFSLTLPLMQPQARAQAA